MTSTHTYGGPGKQVVLAEYGEDPLDAVNNHLSIEAQQAPDPASLSPMDVVVAVRSAAVGWVDLLMSSGQYQHMVAPPYTPGLEYSGQVVWVGADVDPTKIKLGDSVLSDGLLTGPRSQGAHRKYGGFATYAVAPQQALIPLPEGFSFDQGCNLLGNYETAYHCLVACGGLQAGEVVLIHGASGSTGLAAVHLAKIIGATVIATGRNIDKLRQVKEQGADHVIRTVNDEQPNEVRRFRDEVKELTGGEGVDVVYDGVGGALSLEALRSVRFGGRFVIVGWASTPFVARGKGKRGAPNANQLPTNLVMMKGLDVLGSPTVITTARHPAIRSKRLATIFEWVDQGLRPRVGPAYPLEQVVEAMKAKWSSRFVGGCVLHPQP